MQQLGDRDMAAGLLFSCCHSSFSESVAWGPGRSVGFNKWLSCQFWAKGTSDSSRIAALDFCSASNQSFPVWCELAVTSENVFPPPESSHLMMSAMGSLGHVVLSICDSHFGPFLLLCLFSFQFPFGRHPLFWENSVHVLRNIIG